MKVLLLFLGLFFASLTKKAHSMQDLNSIPVCATLNNVSKTFANIWHIYHEFRTTGQLWVPVATGSCPVNSIDCTSFEPVCAVSSNNFFKTFPNKCILEAEHKSTGTVWNIVFNGICSENPGDGFALSNTDPQVSQAPETLNAEYSKNTQNNHHAASSSLTTDNYNRPYKQAEPVSASMPPSVAGHYSKNQKPLPTGILGNLYQSSVPTPAATVPSKSHLSQPYDVAQSPAFGYHNSAPEPQPYTDYNQSSAPNPATPAPLQSLSPPLYSATSFPVAGNCDPETEPKPSPEYPPPSPDSDNYNQTPAIPAVSVPSQPNLSPSYDVPPSPASGYYNSAPEPQLSANYNQGLAPNPPVAVSLQSESSQPSYDAAPFPASGHHNSTTEPEPSPIYPPPSHISENCNEESASSPAVSNPIQSQSPSSYAAASSSSSGHYNPVKEPKPLPAYSPPLPNSVNYNQNSTLSPAESVPPESPSNNTSPSPASENYNPFLGPQPSGDYNQGSAPNPAAPAPLQSNSLPSYYSKPSPDSGNYNPGTEPKPSSAYPPLLPNHGNYNQKPAAALVVSVPPQSHLLPSYDPVSSLSSENYNPAPELQPVGHYNHSSVSKPAVPTPLQQRLPSTASGSYNPDAGPKPLPNSGSYKQEPARNPPSGALQAYSPPPYEAESLPAPGYPNSALEAQPVVYNNQGAAPNSAAPAPLQSDSPQQLYYAAPFPGAGYYKPATEPQPSSPTNAPHSHISGNYNPESVPSQAVSVPSQPNLSSPYAGTSPACRYYNHDAEPPPSGNYNQGSAPSSATPASPTPLQSNSPASYNASPSPASENYNPSRKPELSPVYAPPSPNSSNCNQEPVPTPVVSVPSQSHLSPSYDAAPSPAFGYYDPVSEPHPSGYDQGSVSSLAIPVRLKSHSPQVLNTAPTPTAVHYSPDTGPKPSPAYAPPSQNSGNYNQQSALTLASGTLQADSSPSYYSAPLPASGDSNSVQEPQASDNNNQGSEQKPTAPASLQLDSPQRLYDAASSPASGYYNPAAESQPSPIYSPPSHISGNCNQESAPGLVISDPLQPHSPPLYDAAPSSTSGHYNPVIEPKPSPAYPLHSLVSVNYNQESIPVSAGLVPSQSVSYDSESSSAGVYNNPASEYQPSSDYNQSSASNPAVSVPLQSYVAPSLASGHDNPAQEPQPSDKYKQSSASNPTKFALSQYDTAPSAASSVAQEPQPSSDYSHSLGPKSAITDPSKSDSLPSYDASQLEAFAQYNHSQKPQPTPTYPAPAPTFNHYNPVSAAPALLAPSYSLLSYDDTPSPVPGNYNQIINYNQPSAETESVTAPVPSYSPSLSARVPLPDSGHLEQDTPSNVYYNNHDAPNTNSSPARDYQNSPSNSEIFSGISEGNNSYNNESHSDEDISNSDKYKAKNDAGYSNRNVKNEGQTIYNGVVYQGPYYYEPKYRHINLGNLNVLPDQSSDSAPALSAVHALVSANAGYNTNTFEQFLKQLQYVAQRNVKSDY